MTECVLTIAIPTYNGARYLEETIYSILDQILDLNVSNVEILISDNASTDNTRIISERFLKSYPNIFSYNRNESNIGYDRNVDALFKLSKGRYVEILGDDDFLAEGALSNILKILNKDKTYSVMLLNVSFLDIITGKEYGETQLAQDFTFNNGDDFFREAKWRTSAVSSLIILRSAWNTINLEPYFGNQWIHISGIIAILGKESSSYSISKKSVTVRTGNQRWTNNNGNHLKLGLIHLSVISAMKTFSYRKSTYDFFLEDRFKTNLRDIYNLAPLSLLERIKIANIMIRLFKNFYTLWIVNLPFLLVISYPLQISKLVIRSVYYYTKQSLFKTETAIK